MKKGLKFNLNFLVALAVVCTLGLFNTANAQDGASADSTGSKLTVGLRAGLNVSKLRATGDYNASNYIEGAQVGAFAHFQLNKWVGESVELAWSQGGARGLQGQNAFGQRTVNLYTNNVQLNVLSHFKVPVLSVYEPRVFIGPSFDFNTYNKANVEGMATDAYVKYSTDATNHTKAFDFGIVAGAGVDFDLKFAKLMLDARYRHGISDIRNRNFNQNSGISFSNSSWRTSGFSFQVGLGFSL
jgi:hypothetical protein